MARQQARGVLKTLSLGVAKNGNEYYKVSFQEENKQLIYCQIFENNDAFVTTKNWFEKSNSTELNLNFEE